MADPRTETVRAGYDQMAGWFAEWGARVEGDPRDRFLEEFFGLLPPSGSVLDLGCGAGVPSTKRLAETFKVIGVDISEAQIALARLNVPDATFVHADLLDLDFPAASFDGVAAFYSISHIPRETHPRVFSLVRRWLRPGGIFLAALGVRDTPDATVEWLGVQMFFSSYGANENLRLLAEAGLDVVRAEEVSMREPEGEATFLWVICRHPVERSKLCT
jgi:SAM-dependent methyltransferase